MKLGNRPTVQSPTYDFAIAPDRRLRLHERSVGGVFASRGGRSGTARRLDADPGRSPKCAISAAHRKKNPRLTDDLVEAFLTHVARVATVATDPPAVFAYPRDLKDEPYLNLAIREGASLLASWDNDLLDL